VVREVTAASLTDPALCVLLNQDQEVGYLSLSSGRCNGAVCGAVKPSWRASSYTRPG
jgi:hypothetical protein